MSLISTSRRAVAAAAIAALGYVIEGAIVFHTPQGDSNWSTSGYVTEAAFSVALIATIVALGPLAAGTGRLGRIALAVARTGLVSMSVSSVASLGAGESTLGPAFVLGLLAILAGFLGLAVAAARGGQLPWWCGPLPLTGFVLGIGLGDHGGGVIMGAAFAAVGLAVAGSRAPAAVAGQPRSL